MSSEISPNSNQGLFPMTQWSVISDARGKNDADATEGLKQLALAYWKPLYLYLRKRGESHEDASDSVQGFFEFVLSSEFLKHVDRTGGKFRSYFLKSLERWRGQQRERAHALKRGGGASHVDLEGIDEMRDIPDLASEISPELAFDRQWAMELVNRGLKSLRQDYEKRGRSSTFEALQGALPGAMSILPSYAELAQTLETSEGTARKAVFDLRNAFSVKLKEEIRATVRTGEEAEEELRYLISVLTSKYPPQ